MRLAMMEKEDRACKGRKGGEGTLLMQKRNALIGERATGGYAGKNTLWYASASFMRKFVNMRLQKGRKNCRLNEEFLFNSRNSQIQWK